MKQYHSILTFAAVTLMLSACSTAQKQNPQEVQELSLEEIITNRVIAQSVMVKGMLSTLVESGVGIERGMIAIRQAAREIGIPLSKNLSRAGLDALSVETQAKIVRQLALKPVTRDLFKLGKTQVNAEAVTRAKNLLSGKSIAGESKGVASGKADANVTIVDANAVNTLIDGFGGDKRFVRPHVTVKQQTGVSLIESTDTCTMVKGANGKPGLDKEAAENLLVMWNNQASLSKWISSTSTSNKAERQVFCGTNTLLHDMVDMLKNPEAEVATTTSTLIKQCKAFPQAYAAAIPAQFANGRLISAAEAGCQWR